MRFDYKSILTNRYILYLFFVLVLIQLIVYLNLGEYSYAVIMVAIGWFVSRFNKNMIIVLFVALILTHLVKIFMSNTREGLEGSSDKSGTTVTVSAASGATEGSSATANMSSQDIKQTIQEQEDKKKEIQSQINDIYLNNKKELANLEVVLKEAQAAQASVPST